MLRSLICAVCLSLFLISASSLGAVPNGMSYQGYLTDRDGVAMSDELLVTFSIYAVEFGGSPLWSDTLLVDADNGLFSVRLGRPANPFPAGLFDTALWLGITVESDMEMIPRQELTSVGFSFKAEDAESVQGKSAFELDQSDHVANLANPHGVTATQVGAVGQVALDAHTTDTNNPHLVNAAQSGAADVAVFNAHAATMDAHHSKYTDSEAVSAMGPEAPGNPLRHNRFSDEEATSAVLAADGPGSGIDADTLDGVELSVLQDDIANNTAAIEQRGRLMVRAAGVPIGSLITIEYGLNFFNAQTAWAISNTGYIFGVGFEDGTLAIAENTTILRDNPSCTGAMYIASGQLGFAINNGLVIQFIAPSMTVMIPPDSPELQGQYYFDFGQNCVSTNDAVYEVVPNDPAITGVMNSPLAHPITIGP